MVKIELRDDGWFEVGEDAKDFSHIIYRERQNIKQKLEQLSGGKVDRNSLEKSIKEISTSRPFFRGNLYLRGNQILVEAPGLPGECYLGEIID